MKMQWLIGSCMGLAVCAVSSAALAGSESGFYVGASLGTAEVEYSDDSPDFSGVDDIDFEDDDTAYKIFGGYNFGLVPFLNIAAEVAYVDFGSQEGRIAGIKGNKVELDAISAAGLVGFDLGPLGLFAKAGLVNWDGDIDTFAGDESESGTDPLYGVGAKVQLGPIAVRAEYERYDLDKFRVDYYSVGAVYTF